MDPDGRADENYFTTFGGNVKIAYKHNNRSVKENIDIESLAFYSLNTSELYYLVTQKNKSDLITFNATVNIPGRDKTVDITCSKE